MEDFNVHKWFKKQYLEEGHTEDKMERDMEARKRSKLSPNELKKLDAIRAFYRGETDVLPADLKEDDLDEIAFGDAGTDKRTGQVVGEIIKLLTSTGVDVYEVMEELGQEFGISFEFGRDF